MMSTAIDPHLMAFCISNAGQRLRIAVLGVAGGGVDLLGSARLEAAIRRSFK